MKQPLLPYFVPATFCFRDGTAQASADGCVFEMLRPSVRTEEGLLVPLEDLGRMFGLQLSIREEKSGVTLSWKGHTVFCPVTELDSTPYLCVNEDLAEKFAYVCQTFSNHYGTFTVLAKEKPTAGERGGFAYSFFKKVGILNRAYYMEDVCQLIPYSLYVPTYYRPEKKLALAVVLHGLLGENPLADAGKELCGLAEQRGYILCAPNGYTKGMHGCPYPMKRDFVPDDVDPENPAGLDAEQKRIYPLCEKADMTAVYRVLKDYAIDGSRVFLLGNSMGGDGTFYLGQKYNTLWRGIAPCAGGSDLRFYPYDRLRELPVCMVIGTEDAGYEIINELYEELKSHDLDVRIVRMPGWNHVTAWIGALQSIFDFFGEISGKNQEEEQT